MAEGARAELALEAAAARAGRAEVDALLAAEKVKCWWLKCRWIVW